MGQDAKKPKSSKLDHEPPPPPPVSELGKFQFGDDQVESSWFKKAVAAGIRYTKAKGEQTGSKLMAVLNLDETNAKRVAGSGSFAPKLAVEKEKSRKESKSELEVELPKPPAAKEAKAAKAAKAAAAPAPEPEKKKPAFGPPERTLFKTAINQFLQTAEQRRQSAQAQGQVKFRPSAAMMGGGPTLAQIFVKRALLFVLIAGGGFFLLKLFVGKPHFNAAQRYGDSEVDEDLLLEDETVVAPKKPAPVKHKGKALP